MEKLSSGLKTITAWYKMDKHKKFYKRKWFITTAILLILIGVTNFQSVVTTPKVKLTFEQSAINNRLAKVTIITDVETLEGNKKIADTKQQ